jgi:hypothetical protein
MREIAQLPFALGIGVAIVVSLVSAGAVYGLGRLALRGVFNRQDPHDRDQTWQLAKVVFGITGTFMAFIISFSFNGVRSDYNALRDAIQLEAAQVVDIAADLTFFGSDDALLIREDLEQYLRLVIDEEWPHLATGTGPLPSAIKAFDGLQFGMHSLNAETPAQKSLRSNLITDIDEVSDYRQHRAFQSRPDPPQFLYVAILGYLLTIMGLVLFEATPVRAVLVGFYCAFVGIVIYSMLILGSPFVGPVALTPEPLEHAFRYMASL